MSHDWHDHYGRRYDPDTGEDLLMKYTGYTSMAEADYYENGGYEADQDALWAEREEKHKEWMDGILDELKLTGGCRECPWIIETAEWWEDKDSEYKPTPEQMHFLHLACVGCHAKGTGEMSPADEKRVQRYFDDFDEWMTGLGLDKTYCTGCPVPYEVYGKYKDPDDEWNALDSKERCLNCEHFGEE